MDATLTITLAKPITFEGGSLEAVTLCEPTAKQVADAERKLSATGDVAAFRNYQMALFQAASGLDDTKLNLLPISVTNQANDHLAAAILVGTEAVKDPPAETSFPVTPDQTPEGIRYDSLTLSEPTTGQVRGAELAMAGLTGSAAIRAYEISLVSRVSKVPWAAVCGMPVSTVNRAAAYCRGFTRGGSQTTPA